MIELIMKRLGVQKSVVIMRDLVSGMVYTIFWSIILSVLFYLFILKDKMGLGILIIFALLNVI